MPVESTLPKRFPLAIELSNRDASTHKDAQLVNCYLEAQPNGDGTFIIKRPGTVKNTHHSYGTAGEGKGIFNWLLDIYQVVDSKLIKTTNLGVTTVLGTVDGTAGFHYAFESIQGPTPTLVLTNSLFMYAYSSSGGFQTLTPSNILYGLAYLDGTLYYGASSGVIQGSGINNITLWDPLNAIQAQIEPDLPIAIAKHLVYVILFKQWSTEVFYDNGNPTGSPLLPNQGAKMNIGCAHGNSVKEILGDLYWMSFNRSGALSVFKMNNLTPQEIATPAIQRLIESSNVSTTPSTVFSWSYKGEGHTFYVLTLTDLNLTLAYDIVEDKWSRWADTNGNYLPFSSSTFVQSSSIVQHMTNGNVYTMNSTSFTDDGSLFTVDIYTPEFDGKVDRRKTLNILRFNADQTNGSVLQVRSNDFNYSTDKWTSYRRVNLGNQRPVLTNCGTFYKRAYNLKHRCNTSLRIYSIDISLELGTL